MGEVEPALRDAVTTRLEELGLSVSEVARRAGVTRQGLAPLIKGERRNYRARLKYPVCDVFGWTHDSIDRLLAGDQPVEVSGPPPDEIAALRDAVVSLGRAVRVLLLEANERRRSDDEWSGPLDEALSNLP